MDGRRVSRWILNKYCATICTGFIWLGIGSSGGSFQHGDEPLGYLKDEEFLDQVSGYQLLKEKAIPWSQSPWFLK
jgi:hypothetical protein